ncbi:MAG: hypothetical protein IT176_03930 [Acidobacteria bacterium]|nr:hypothetical protein [Acidobacteriota bacterium]
MSRTASPACSAVQGVRQALELVLHALVSADVAALEASQAGLARAVGILPSRIAAEEDGARLMAEVEAARLALERCRRVGGTVAEMIGAALGAAGALGGYGPSGRARFDVEQRGSVHARA